MLPQILLLISDEDEMGDLKLILDQHVDVTHVRNLSELIINLASGEFEAVFCSWSFYEEFWDYILAQIRKCKVEMPVIVFSRTAGEREWVEVLERGAFDLLVPPYGQRLLLAVLEQATSSCEARAIKKMTPLSEKQAR